MVPILSLSLILSLLLPDNVITYEDLKAILEKGQNFLLVDVRSKEEVDKGHIPGSAHIPSGNNLNYFLKRKIQPCLNPVSLFNYCSHSFIYFSGLFLKLMLLSV